MLIYLIPFLLATFFSVLYYLNLLKLSNFFYAIALFLLSIFSGIRFEVGPYDWLGYQQFFNKLNLNNNIFELYTKENQQFEVGYYLLNYLVKYFDGDYRLIFISSSLFLSYTLYKFTKNFSINRFYILTIYIGYGYYVLNFAQVRQSIAIGFFILGCNFYLFHRGKILPLLIASIGLLFQYSSIIYIITFAVVIYRKNPNINTLLKILFFTGISVYIFSLFIDYYAFIKIISPSSFGDKVEVYEENLTDQGFGQIILAGYFSLLILYLSWNIHKINSQKKFIVLFSIYILFVVCLSVFIFPGSYAVFSRALSLAAIFQAYSMALIMENQKRAIDDIVFASTIVVSFIYLYRAIYLYRDEYIPYNYAFIFLGF